MKHVLFIGILPLIFSSTSFCQVSNSSKFSTTGSNVIAYKQGTSCTASTYSFYMISDAGIQAGTSFYTLPNTSKEVNGIGINPADRFLYGVEYDRDGACAFSNFHLKRYDAAGNSDDLGTLPPISGGSVTAALGCVTSNGNFAYSTKDALGNTYISIVADIASLPVNATATLSINTSKQIINYAGSFSYADWAVHPANGKMYTYGIANMSGVSTGKILELDPETGILQGAGTADATTFLDPVRDNFGGVYFGGDGLLYGVNINTRKLYKIDVATGTVTYTSTMAGSGQIRADMGSYVTGWIILPIIFTKAELLQKNNEVQLHWSVAGSSAIKEFTVEQNTGNGFIAVKRIPLTVANQKGTDFSSPLSRFAAAQYRIRAVSGNGESFYSAIVQNISYQAGTIKLLSNPVQNRTLRFLSDLAGSHSYTIINAGGTTIQSGVVSGTSANTVGTIALPVLSSGIYVLQLAGETPVSIRFMVL